MFDIKKQIETTRDQLNELIINKNEITNDKDLLVISRKLDNLINIYISASDNNYY